MAAGRGLRMAPLTDAVPKPMAPYKGTTLIAEGIASIRDRIPNIHITVGYKGALLAEHVIKTGGVSSVFNTEGHPNAWWLYHTLMRFLDEPTYVLTCDNVVALDFDLLEQNYHELGSPPCMVVPVKVLPGLEGDYIFADGPVVRELSRSKRSEIYCSGIQILNPKKVTGATDDRGDFSAVWDQLIKLEKLYVSSIYPKKWRAVDTWEHLVELNRTAENAS